MSQPAGLDTKITFGKYARSEHTYGNLMLKDPGYVLWLRSQKGRDAYTPQLNEIMDFTTNGDPKFKSRFGALTVIGAQGNAGKQPEKIDKTTKAIRDAEEKLARQTAANQRLEVAYAGEWGAW